MSNLNIQRAFEKRLALLTPLLPTQYENKDYTPVTGTAYQSTYLLPAQPENPTLGDGYYREVGVFQVTLKYPNNGGSQLAKTRADLLVNHFKRGTSMTEAGQVIQVITTPTIAPAFIENERYCIPISVFYRSEIQPV